MLTLLFESFGEGALVSEPFTQEMPLYRENPKLCFEIQSPNDYGTESLTALLYAVERHAPW